MDPASRPSPPQDPVEALVVELLDRVEERGQSFEDALAELCEAHPAQSEPLRNAASTLRSMGLLSVVQRDQDAALPEALGEFRLLRQLGRGGMGLVWLAEQPSLGRRVALKLIRPDQVYDAGSRERFRREVLAVARLAHPNIVPVHAVGEERGIPYLAMEYVPGVSLDRLLQHFATRSPFELRASDALVALRTLVPDEPVSAEVDEEFWSGPWRALALRIARRVAEALEHAHGRGVLHRDVKPSNVLVTQDGRVLLCDFGLARTAGADTLTRSGAMLGSLPTMAPEQVEGKLDELDARTDVYGLGVTLYELLTLRTPYLDPRSAERTRQRILAGRATPPRRFDPGLSADAAVVCQTAMDPDPRRRYLSAGAFAADLSNALAGRPIAARPAGTLSSVGRWARRKPASATSLGLLAVLLVGGPTGYAMQESRSATRVGRELERMRQTLDVLTRIADRDLEDVPEASTARREMLELAREQYLLIAEQSKGSSGVLRAKAAAALAVSARIDRVLDRDQDALREFDQAIAIYEGLARRDVETERALAAALSNRGWLLTEAGDSAGARASYERAAKLLAALPPDPRVEFDVAVNRANQALDLQMSGDLELARAEMAVALLELRAAAEVSDEASRAVYLGWAEGVAAGMAFAAEELDEALAGLDRATTALQRGLAQHPDHRELHEQLVVMRANRNQLLLQLGRAEEARALTLELLDEARALSAAHPDQPSLRADVAACLHHLGASDVGLGDLAAARAAYDESLAIHRALARELPDNLEYRYQTLPPLADQADVLVALGHPEEALELCAQHRDLWGTVHGKKPGLEGLSETRNHAVSSEVRARLALGDTPAALAALGDLVPPDQAPVLVDLAQAVLGADDDATAAERREVAVGLLLRAGAAPGFEPGVLDGAALAAVRDEPRLAALRPSAPE